VTCCYSPVLISAMKESGQKNSYCAKWLELSTSSGRELAPVFPPPWPSLRGGDGWKRLLGPAVRGSCSVPVQLLEGNHSLLLSTSNGSRNDVHDGDKSSTAAIRKLLFSLVPPRGLRGCYEYLQASLSKWSIKEL